MKVLVFGASGQVGQELQKFDNVVALDRNAADLTDPQSCVAHIETTNADAIINAAAYTAVDRAEDDEDTATLVNGHAVGIMAQAAATRNLPFLHISTDYVFDGHGSEPHLPSAATAPLNAYGRSKLTGEKAIQRVGGRHIILRTSWVFSAHGSNFVKTMLRLAESHDHIRVVNDQIGGPTPAADIAAALMEIASQITSTDHPGGTYHFSGAPAVSWAEFAKEIFFQAGRDITVTGIPSVDYPTPAPRPLNSRLSCESLHQDFGISMPDWRKGLAAVLRENKSTKAARTPPESNGTQAPS